MSRTINAVANAQEGRGPGSADAALMIVMVIWGASFAIIKHTYREVDPYAFLAARFILVGLAMLPVVWLYRRGLPTTAREWLGVLGMALTGVAGYQVFFSLGLEFTTASHSTLITSTSPVFAALAAPLLGAPRPRAPQLAGMALALVGVWLLTFAPGEGFHWGTATLKGDLLTLTASASAGLGFALAGRYLGGRTGVGTMALAVIAGSLVITPVGLRAALVQDWSALSPAAWLGLLYATLLAGALGYVLWYHNIGRLGTLRGSVYGFGIPLVGVLTAVLMLGEPFGARQALSTLVLISGVVLTRGWRPRVRSGPKPPLPKEGAAR